MIKKMQKFMSKKNKKGFTLIELIVVIAIIAILAVIAIPRLTGFTDTAKEKTDISNAKLLTNIANIYQAEFSAYPATITALSGSTSVTPGTELAKYLGETITIQKTGNTFTWDSTTATVDLYIAP